VPADSSVIANLLSEAKVETFEEELALITNLLELAFLFDPTSTRLCELIRLLDPQFSLTFTTVLDLFARLVISRIADFSLSGDSLSLPLLSLTLPPSIASSPFSSVCFAPDHSRTLSFPSSRI
jgi:hypothetical protein